MKDSREQKEDGKAYAFFNYDYMNGNLPNVIRLVGERINVNGLNIKSLTIDNLPTKLSKAIKKKLVLGRFPEDSERKLFHQPTKPMKVCKLIYIVKAESQCTKNEKVASRLDRILEEMSRNTPKIPRISHRIVLYRDDKGDFVQYQKLKTPVFKCLE